jgi:release factor glutamine methyltransferase
MTQIREVLAVAVKQLESVDIASARLDAELLLALVTSHDRAWVLAHDDENLTKAQSKSFQDLVQRRASREPLVHLTGNREFYGLDIIITPDVLTPRIETEQMVDWAIAYAPINSGLIDIGTGSGAIALAIAKHRPDLKVSATDVSNRELNIASQNATRHNANIELIESNLWSKVTSKYETITANLPYLNSDADLMPEVKREPAVALFGGPDGLGLYRQFFQDLPKHLSSRGYVFIESDPWQHEALISEAAKIELSPIEKGYFILGFQLIH